MLKMTIEEFDRLCTSNNPFEYLTGEFLGTFDFVLANWEAGNGCKLYEFRWNNVLITSDAYKQMAIDEANYGEDDDDFDFDDDVDETNYDPYLGCDIYDTEDCYDCYDW